MKKLLVICGIVLLVSGCTMSPPCEETWTKTYTAKGVMYVKQESQCVSISFKEAYQ
jgi:hypothetical protein